VAMAVAVAAVVAVIVAALEALAEVVVVLALRDVIAVVAVAGVLVGVAVAVVGAPAVLAVGAAGMQPFLVAVVDGLADQRGAVVVRPVPVALVGVPVAGGRVVVRIVVVVVGTRAPAHLLLAQAVAVSLLVVVLGHAALLAQFAGA